MNPNDFQLDLLAIVAGVVIALITTWLTNRSEFEHSISDRLRIIIEHQDRRIKTLEKTIKDYERVIRGKKDSIHDKERKIEGLQQDLEDERSKKE